jgi:metallo-beta-lactamase class B
LTIETAFKVLGLGKGPAHLPANSIMFYAIRVVSTTWMTHLIDGGKTYTVVFPDGAGFNPGYRVVRNPSYPGIDVDYRNTHHTLELLKPDIWAGHHTEYFDFDGKRKRAATQGVKAWVDSEGYRRFIAGKKSAFEALVNGEIGVEETAR